MMIDTERINWMEANEKCPKCEGGEAIYTSAKGIVNCPECGGTCKQSVPGNAWRSAGGRRKTFSRALRRFLRSMHGDRATLPAARRYLRRCAVAFCEGDRCRSQRLDRDRSGFRARGVLRGHSGDAGVHPKEMTVKQAEELCARAGAPPPPGSSAELREKVKGTIRKTVDGIEFRSTLEAHVYQLLWLWQLAGWIGDLRIQPLFILQPRVRREGKAVRAITYKADFSFLRDGKRVVIDAKGYQMEVFKIKWKMLQAKNPELVCEIWTRETLKQHLASPCGARSCGLAPESSKA